MLKIIIISVLLATAFSQCNTVPEWSEYVRYFPGQTVSFNGYVQTAISINLGSSQSPDNNANWSNRIECFVDCSEFNDWSINAEYFTSTTVIFFRRAYISN